MSMDPEERFDRIERQQEFLAASHAQHVVRMAEIEAHLAAVSRRQDETARIQQENSDQIARNSAQMAQLENLTLRLGRIVEVQADRISALADSQARTDDRLNALIDTVERYISDGRNRQN